MEIAVEVVACVFVLKQVAVVVQRVGIHEGICPSSWCSRPPFFLRSYLSLPERESGYVTGSTVRYTVSLQTEI